jgi:uncharacterized protein YbcI
MNPDRRSSVDSTRPETRSDTANDHGVLSLISNEMVRIYKDQFGRGPTKARTVWAGPDIILVTLEHTLTPAERKLVELGEDGRLRDLRLLFQYAEVEAFCAPVERLTGRKVRAFVSGIDARADLASEMFVLHPNGYDGVGRRGK